MDPSDERTDAVLGDHFAAYRARTLAHVRPPGALAARRGYVRQRQRRLMTALAAFVALVLGAAGGTYALVDHHGWVGPGGHPTASPASRTPSPGTGESPRPGASPSDAGTGSGAPADTGVPPGFKPQSVTFVSTSSAWLLGSAPCLSPRAWSRCPAVLRSQDGGRTWVGVPAPGDAAYLGDIRFADTRNGWIVVRGPLVAKDPGGASGVLYATHDGGATWHTVSLPGKATRVEAAGGRVWVLARADAPAPSAYMAPIGGDTFTQVWSGPGSGIAVHGRNAFLYGVGRDANELGGDIFVVVKDGTGSEQRGPCDYGHDKSVVLAAATDTMLVGVCGGARSGNTQPKQLAVSFDLGVSWAPIGTPDGVGIVRSVAATGPATFLAGAGMPIRVTRDAGRTWTVALAAPGPDGFGYVGFTDDTHGVALPANGSALYLTTDAGRTWTAHQFP